MKKRNIKAGVLTAGCTGVMLLSLLAGCGNTAAGNQTAGSTALQTQGQASSVESEVQGSTASTGESEVQGSTASTGESEVQGSAASTGESEVQGSTETQESGETKSDTGSGLFGTFKAQTIQGDEITDSVFAGAKLTMVNIWATYCGPCIREMPDLGKMNAKYAAQGFQVVGIVSDVTKPQDQTALDIIKKTGADYTHIVLNQELYDNYVNQVQAVPTTIFVDARGKQVGEVYVGAQDNWDSIISAALKEVVSAEKKK